MIYELLISLLAELFLEKKPAKDENRISQRRGENFFFGVKSRAIPSKQATRHDTRIHFLSLSTKFSSTPELAFEEKNISRRAASKACEVA
jgi:hypothetical protein